MFTPVMATLKRARELTSAALSRSFWSRPSMVREGSSIASRDRKSTRLNSNHITISYAVFCLNKKNSSGFLFAGRQGGPRINVLGRERTMPVNLLSRRFRGRLGLREVEGVSEQRKTLAQVNPV